MRYIRPRWGASLHQQSRLLDLVVQAFSKSFQTNTYRAVYAVKFSELVYVLHAFQKKSKKGIATPKTDLDLIKKRLGLAEQDYKTRLARRGRDK